MKVLMVGVDKSTKGGMWTVVENYLEDRKFCEEMNLKYIPTSTSGNIIKRIIFNAIAIIRIFFYSLFNSYDILHVHMSEKGSVFRKGIIINIAKMKKSKIVIHMHGAELEKWYLTLKPKTQKKVRRIIDKGNKIIILGKYWEKFIGSLVSDKSKIEVVYNAVKVPSQNNYNSKNKNILFLGVIGARKGIYDLLDAMVLIRDNKMCECKLLLYGPDKTTGIENLIKEKELNTLVEYKGWMTNTQKNSVFKEIAVNVLPSYNEGLPMTILETMAFGIPNISTNVAAIPEILNNSNGILIEPGNANILAESIANLINDDKLKEEKSENAYKIMINTFSIKHHIDKIKKIYIQMKG